MLATPSIVRAMFWPASLGVHAIAFIAAGHAVAQSSSSVQRLALEDRVIDVAADVFPTEEERAAAVGARHPSRSVPRPTHTHSYPVAPDHDAHPHDPALVHVPFVTAPPQETDVVAALPDAPVRFTMTIANEPIGVALDARVGNPAAIAAEANPDSDSLPLPEERVSSPARLAGFIAPAYPPDARAQEIEADVVLAIVVARAGNVVDARIIQGAGASFDAEALRAARAARFVPAQHEGHAVAVRMRWLVSFRLR